MKWTFFVGLGVGAAVGMLIAPKSGVELRGRQRIQPLVDKARERVQSAVDQARESHAAVDSVKEQASRGRGSSRDVVNEWP